MTSLLQPATPDWFRSRISTYLSLLPLRPEGVRNTINFIAGLSLNGSQDSGSYSSVQTNLSLGPSLSMEVLNQVSKLLSSVPSSLGPDMYFSTLAPQLLQLLGDTNPDIRRAAAYTVGTGILGRRKYGAPGTIGWIIFARPIIESFNPIEKIKMPTAPPARDPDRNGLPTVIVSKTSLGKALERLASLVLLHPNPGLTKRLITPCALSLWNLLCYSKGMNRSSWTNKLQQILFTYFKTSVGIEQLIMLSDGLLWDGESSWMYGPGPTGGIEIRQRLENSLWKANMVTLLQNIDIRINEFQNLLKSGVADDVEIGTLFVHVNNHWLIGSDGIGRKNTLGAGDDSRKDPLRSLVYAKLAQKMLEDFKDKLAANPKGIIELVNQLFAAYVLEHEEAETRRAKASIPSLSGLSAIVNPDLDSKGSTNVTNCVAEEDSVEMISVALSLLSAILSSPEFYLDPGIFSLLSSVRSNLTRVTSFANFLPISIAMSATNTLGLLNFHVSLPSTNPKTATKHLDSHSSDRKSHHQALTYLIDPLPPIRAQGISLLTTLITKPSPILDIPSTAILLQSLLQDEDEYIYLSAIEALGLLASRHPKTVVKRLLEQYVDADETTGLDVRIRTGEALLKTVEKLGTALVGDVAQTVGYSMIEVAGRRARKPKALAARQKSTQEAEDRKKEADEAWGGEAPTSDPHDLNDNDKENMLGAWESSDGEDDIRIRASALSILGVAIETHIASLGVPLIATGIDLVLHVLKLETSPGRAILRRAAVLVIMSILNAVDAANDAADARGGARQGYGLEGEGVGHVLAVLRAVEGTEDDQVVLGHVRAVIEQLERWRKKTFLQEADGIMGLPAGSLGCGFGFGLQGGKMAGLAVHPEVPRQRPRIEEME